MVQGLEAGWAGAPARGLGQERTRMRKKLFPKENKDQYQGHQLLHSSSRRMHRAKMGELLKSQKSRRDWSKQ